jgi:hypothetical protein
MDSNETKKQTAQLFLDIFAVDTRLQWVDEKTLRTLVEHSVTFDMEGKVVFQGARLYDELVGRKVSQKAVMQALVVLEPRAAKMGVAVRQPADVQRLTPEERQALSRDAPQSRSQFVEELVDSRVPTILKDARQARSRSIMIWAGVGGIAVVAAAIAIWSLPKGFADVHVAFTGDAIPCSDQRSANQRVFCTVDEALVGSETDDQIRARMKVSTQEAKDAGFNAVAFLKPGTGDDGEKHRFRPWLWARDPKGATKAPASSPPTKP